MRRSQLSQDNPSGYENSGREESQPEPLNSQQLLDQIDQSSGTRLISRPNLLFDYISRPNQNSNNSNSNQLQERDGVSQPRRISEIRTMIDQLRGISIPVLGSQARLQSELSQNINLNPERNQLSNSEPLSIRQSQLRSQIPGNSQNVDQSSPNLTSFQNLQRIDGSPNTPPLRIPRRFEFSSYDAIFSHHERNLQRTSDQIITTDSIPSDSQLYRSQLLEPFDQQIANLVAENHQNMFRSHLSSRARSQNAISGVSDSDQQSRPPLRIRAEEFLNIDPPVNSVVPAPQFQLQPQRFLDLNQFSESDSDDISSESSEQTVIRNNPNFPRDQYEDSMLQDRGSQSQRSNNNQNNQSNRILSSDSDEEPLISRPISRLQLRRRRDVSQSHNSGSSRIRSPRSLSNLRRQHAISNIHNLPSARAQLLRQIPQRPQTLLSRGLRRTASRANLHSNIALGIDRLRRRRAVRYRNFNDFWLNSALREQDLLLRGDGEESIEVEDELIDPFQINEDISSESDNSNQVQRVRVFRNQLLEDIIEENEDLTDNKDDENEDDEVPNYDSEWSEIGQLFVDLENDEDKSEEDPLAILKLFNKFGNIGLVVYKRVQEQQILETQPLNQVIRQNLQMRHDVPKIKQMTNIILFLVKYLIQTAQNLSERTNQDTSGKQQSRQQIVSLEAEQKIQIVHKLLKLVPSNIQIQRLLDRLQQFYETHQNDDKMYQSKDQVIMKDMLLTKVILDLKINILTLLESPRYKVLLKEVMPLAQRFHKDLPVEAVKFLSQKNNYSIWGTFIKQNKTLSLKDVSFITVKETKEEYLKHYKQLNYDLLEKSKNIRNDLIIENIYTNEQNQAVTNKKRDIKLKGKQKRKEKYLEKIRSITLL
ncbi:UNKNOWN [Stylonychia lemnae]|uniref:Uncharacterized protein n=1 Tax=Stylonychia lemnae TaxID=5949 RepID=A0A078AEQ3_STYLE|nr:UNKNOWN [Stylonychia lemnae]|eukprot:CDW80321.1 UNKNOWN [Stylonychia lemnae]